MPEKYEDYIPGDLSIWILCRDNGVKLVPVGSRFFRTRKEARKASREKFDFSDPPFPVKLTNA